MFRKYGLVSIGVLVGLLAAVGILSSINPTTSEVAAVPTTALLPTVTTSPIAQGIVQPTPMPQESSVVVSTSIPSPVPATVEASPTATTQSAVTVPSATAISVLPIAPPVTIPIPAAPVPDQLVIHFDPASTVQERAAYIQQIGGTVNSSIDALNTVTVNVPQSVAAKPLPESPLVKTSEPDYYVVALDMPPMNDPQYAQQWALPVIGAANGWSSLPANPPTITVAVVDSGICANHPDLVGRIVTGYDFVENDTIPQDDFGHGCEVSGVIAANPNNGLGIVGVAPNAKVMPLRVLDAAGNGSYSGVSAAIVYAVDNGAQIINLSLGGGVPATILEDAVNYAAAHNVLLIAASGNTGGSVLYPAAYPSVIAVASIDSNLQLSSFSSFGPEVDLLAPGRNIVTTSNDGNYTTTSGTSFAAPQVAGIAAMELAIGQPLTLGGGIVAFNSGAVSPTSTPAPTTVAPGSIVTLNGWLMINSGDPEPGSTALPQRLTYLVDKQGTRIANFTLDFATSHNLYGQQVELTGIVKSISAQSTNLSLDVTSIQPALNTQSSDQSVIPLSLTGSQPWVNLLCKFSDISTTPSTPAQIDSLFSSTYPGLNNYWQTVSYNNINIDGTTTASGWVNLPQPRSYYVGTGNPNIMLDRLTNDCIGANSGIVFADYVGINMMFNGNLDCCAWGGSYYLPGTNQVFRMTWLPTWSQHYDVIGHEMGHGFDFPHSSGPLDSPPSYVYVSDWDVMSAAGGTCVVTSNSMCVAQGTIAYHLDIDGWIPSNKRTTIAYGTVASVDLQTLSSTTVSTDSLVAIIPVGGSSTHFYTVEARELTGYDQNVPGKAIVIHDVNTATRSQTPALVVDANDGNNNVNDAGAMWTVGERYYDAINRISVSVVGSTATGFHVNIGNNVAVPTNDNFDAAKAISSLNFTETVNSTLATIEATDPTLACSSGQKYYSLWYKFTPASPGTLRVKTAGSSYDTALAIWTGTKNNLQLIANGCNDDYNATPQSQVDVVLNAGTAYYIEVVGASEADFGSLTFASLFTAYPVPLAPTLLQPAPSGLSTNDTTPQFQWNTVANGAQYHIQIDNTANFSSPEAETTANVLTFTPVTPLAEGLYYWRVQGINSIGLIGAWSAVWQVTVDTTKPNPPNLIAPADNPLPSTNNKPIFSWQPVAGAVRYQLLLDTHTPPLYSVQNAALTTYTPLNGLLIATYYWCVKAIDVAGNVSDCSPIRSLSFISPANVAPPRNYFTTSTPTLTWNSVSWASAYEIQIDNNADFSSSEYDVVILSSNAHSHTVTTPLPDAFWFWRVRARQQDGTWGAWSLPDSFAIKTP
jgi:thermitase